MCLPHIKQITDDTSWCPKNLLNPHDFPVPTPPGPPNIKALYQLHHLLQHIPSIGGRTWPRKPSWKGSTTFMICNLSMEKKKDYNKKKWGQKVPPPHPKKNHQKMWLLFFWGGGWVGWDGKTLPATLEFCDAAHKNLAGRVGGSHPLLLPLGMVWERWEGLLGKGSPIIVGLLGEIHSKNRLLSISNWCTIGSFRAISSFS